MKLYHLYVFTQEACPPCHRLHKYVDHKLTDDEKAELDFVPLKTPEGKRTALAEELSVELSPTLVVVHETKACRVDSDGFVDCDLEEEPVERFVGANNIIEHLDATIDAYTLTLTLNDR